jgi:hypothetical protein
MFLEKLKGSNDLLEHMGDHVIENKDLQEENHTLKIDLKDLNKCEPDRYKKMDKALITNSDKKNIAKQYLWNKLRGEATNDDRKKTKWYEVPSKDQRSAKVVI